MTGATPASVGTPNGTKPSLDSQQAHAILTVREQTVIDDERTRKIW